jgi:hypothetical protein
MEAPTGLFARRKKTTGSARLQAWLELFRLPNLLTVPGDVLAGASMAVLAGTQTVDFWCLSRVVLAVLAIYAMGLVQNDWIDLAEDRYHRPKRPLPSKRISCSSAALAFLLCLALGVLVALSVSRQVFVGTLLLVALAWSYNVFLKKRLWGGAISMGLCRGMSVLLGAISMGWQSAVLPVFVGTATYVGCVTWFAEGENRKQIPDARIYYPLYCFVIAWLLSLPMLLYYRADITPGSFMLSLLCFLAAFLSVGYAGFSVHNRAIRPEQMRALIASWLRSLLLWQAGWIVLFDSTWAVAVMVVLLLFWPLGILLNKYFSQS